MAINLINRGSVANDGTGDNLRTGAEKVNSNFTEIYTAIGDGTTISISLNLLMIVQRLQVFLLMVKQ